MLSETALKRLCKPVVYRRALRTVESGEHINRRACRFEEGEVVLRARVDAQSSWDAAHRTMVVLDNEESSVTYYECDCRALHAGDSPCDHVMAVLIDFGQNADLYEGYETANGSRTTRNVARLMDKVDALQPDALLANVPTVRAGTVRLEPTLSYELGFELRFRIAAPKGSYALKSIGEFVDRVESRAFASYGKLLAFEHVRSSFEPKSWQVTEFLTRAIQNRRAYALERAAGRSRFGSTAAQPMRELRLSAPELWDLLRLYEDEGIDFEDRSSADGGGMASCRHIVAGDPAVAMRIEALDDGGFELTGAGGIRVVVMGGRALAWDDRTIYRCTAGFSQNADVLSLVLDGGRERMVLSAQDAPRFCATALRRLESCVNVTTPEQLDVLRPQPCELEFYLDYRARQDMVTCDARARYGNASFPLMEPRTSAAVSDEQALDVEDEGRGVVRDARAEAYGREVVRRYFVHRDGATYSQAKGDELGTIVYEAVEALQEVGSVFAYPAFERLRSKVRPQVRVGISVKSNLLRLDIHLEELPQEELSGLLRSYQRKEEYHRLSDGSFVSMKEAKIEQAGRVVDELGLDPARLGEATTLPAYKALLLDHALTEEEADASVKDYVSRIRSNDVAQREVPASLEAMLRPYQQEGFRWLARLCDLGLCGILADEMGLGKSVQLISFLLAYVTEARKVGPSLVVCPSSLVYNWKAEFDKFAPELSVYVVSGVPDERRRMRHAADADVLVTSYDLLRRDIGDYEQLQLWCVALDEAQYIKNPATQVAQSARRLRANHRVALTGTPVENRLSELWSIFDFLMPGLLGPYERFRERFERPIVEDEDDRTAVRLREALRPFILRRVKRDVARDLPDKIEQVVRTRMDDVQGQLYAAQMQETRMAMADLDQEPGGGRFQILALITRLRQICCDPRLLYDGYDSVSCKTEAIMTLVRRVTDAGEKVLVFSQFTSYLNIISSELDRAGIAHYVIQGNTPSSRRVDLVNRFNADSTPVFLISLKAGGTGLNLTGATVVVHADPWWNVAAQNQATDRAHRIGQTREVTVYKVIVGDTIEERILELQRTKAELADAVVQGDVSSASLSSLTREDLEDLLG